MSFPHTRSHLFFAALLAASLARAATVIDTSIVYQWNGITYSFDAGGQAFTPQGVQVTFISYGINPLVPCDADCYAIAPPLPTPEPTPGPQPLPPDVPPIPPPSPPKPVNDTPEPRWLIGAGLVMAGSRRRA